VSPFDVLIPTVPDMELGGLLSVLNDAGFSAPVITPAAAVERAVSVQRPTPAASDELPERWTLVRERSGEAYRWPEYREEYSEYLIYQAQVGDGKIVQIALGHAVRPNKWGRDRRYVVAFLSRGAPVTPLVEFLEADDYETTRDFLAIIRGMDGGRKMYGPRDSLPQPYVDRFRTAMYGDRVHYSGVFNKVVVVVREDDVDGMCNHALLQARRRGDI
jgi:hypothetical protein